MSHPICIIDDDNDVREIICFALDYDGIAVISFASAFDAEKALLSMVPEEWPCLIIVDFMMPDMDGVSFIHLLRNKYAESIGKIPIVLNTALPPSESDNLAGDIIILEKPVELDLLLSTARSYYHKNEGPSSSPLAL